MLYLFKKDFDFAIRICAYLAGIKHNKPISVSKLSSKLLITKPFATKIIYSLRQSNLIGSQQGKTGGVFLNKDPKEISLYVILESMGFNKTISECITEETFCPLPSPCKIHSYFMNVENKLIDDLKRKKLSSYSFTDSDLKYKTK